MFTRKEPPHASRRLAAFALALAAGGTLAAAPAHTQDLFVANSNGSPASEGSISEFTSSGGVPSPTGQVFANNNATNGVFVPVGLAFDGAGDLFAANSRGGLGSITRFTSSGGSLSSAGQIFAAPTAANGLNEPTGLAFDSGGDLFVASEGDNTLKEFANSGGTLISAGQRFATATAVPEPSPLALLCLGTLPLALLSIRKRRPERRG